MTLATRVALDNREGKSSHLSQPARGKAGSRICSP
jgi:hypothetical protein